jgi:hypothetical protein
LVPDPLEFAAGDANLYRYCSNNSVNATDSYGLASDTEFNPIYEKTVGGFYYYDWKYAGKYKVVTELEPQCKFLRVYFREYYNRFFYSSRFQLRYTLDVGAINRIRNLIANLKALISDLEQESLVLEELQLNVQNDLVKYQQFLIGAEAGDLTASGATKRWGGVKAGPWNGILTIVSGGFFLLGEYEISKLAKLYTEIGESMHSLRVSASRVGALLAQQQNAIDLANQAIANRDYKAIYASGLIRKTFVPLTQGVDLFEDPTASIIYKDYPMSSYTGCYLGYVNGMDVKSYLAKILANPNNYPRPSEIKLLPASGYGGLVGGP